MDATRAIKTAATLVVVGCAAPITTEAPLVVAPPPTESDVAQRVTRSVVIVRTDGYFGSGFLVGGPDLVATADHILAATDRCSVEFDDGTTVDAVVEERGLGDDVALLRLAAPVDRTPLSLRPDGVVMGEPVAIVGMEEGRTFLASWGRAASSKTGYEFLNGEWIPVVYFDAETLPGSSGAPWTDGAGRVVASNTAGFPDKRYGFQYGVSARRVADRIAHIAHRRPSLHLGLHDPDGAAQSTPGLVGRRPGPVVESVGAGGAAARAGIAVADCIVAVDGAPCRNIDELFQRIEPHVPGDVVRLAIRRGAASMDVEVTLDAARDSRGK